MSDEFFIENQVKFMYGKYYHDIINNYSIKKENSNNIISVIDCFNIDNLAEYNNNGTRERLKEFINILKRFWKKDQRDYFISCNWHDNVHYDKFIITYNRDFNTINQVIFPLYDYHLPCNLRVIDDRHFNNKQNKIIWRGTSTGHDEIQHNKRYNIISRNFNIHNEIDIGFSNLCQVVYENNRDSYHRLQKNYIDKNEQLNYKFILNIEGNDTSSSFPWALASNSCPLHNYPFKSETYIFGMKLEPYVHFIPINNDGSDLVEKYNWCINNLNKCEEIANNGKRYMEKYTRDDLFDEVMVRFFNLYPKTID